MTLEEKEDLRKRYGAGAPIHYLRTWQQKINKYRNEFEPEGLAQYWEDNSKKYNKESFSMIEGIETHLKKRFKDLLHQYHGENWFYTGIPKKVYDQANKLASEKMFNNPGSKVEPWDCLHLIDYRDIAVYGSNWSNIFSTNYTYPTNLKQNVSKDEKTKWMVKINDIRNDLFHDYSIKKNDYDTLNSIYKWITSID
jgi:DNA sulfur modification protein DndB